MIEIFPPWCDGTIHFAVQEFLNARTNLAVGPAPRACVVRSLEDGGHTCEQLRPDGRADCRFQRRPRDTRVLSNRHHGLSHEYMRNTRQGEESLDEGRAGCPILAVEKERATRMHRPADRELARVGVGL
jgi:hypothetical protein